MDDDGIPACALTAAHDRRWRRGGRNHARRAVRQHCSFAEKQASPVRSWWRLFAAVDSPRLRLPGGGQSMRRSPARRSLFRVPGSGLRRVIRRSSMAQTSVRQLSSPANRPITLVGLLTSPRERSSRFVDRHRRRCRVGSARARRGRRDRRRGSWMRRYSRRCRARGRALGASAWRPLIASSSARRYACLTRSRSRSGSLA